MEVDREEFLEMLSVLKRAASPRDLNPIYQQIILDDGHAYSFNGEYGLLAKGIPGLSCAASSDPLIRAVSGFQSKKIEIVPGDKEVVLVSGRSKVRLLAGDPRMFPRIFPSGYIGFCNADNITESVRRCLSLIDSDKPLSQIGIQDDGVYATDGHRVCRAKLSAPTQHGRVTLTEDSSKVFCSLGQPNNTFISPTQFVAAFDRVIFVSALCTSRVPFPAIDKMCSVVHMANVKALPEGFDAALKRVSVTIEKSGGAVMESTGDDLILTTQHGGVGHAEDAFSWPFHKFKIRVSPNQVLAAFAVTRHVDWSSVLSADPRSLRFVLPDFDHFVSLMEL